MADVFGTVQRIVAKAAGRGTAHNIQMDNGQWYGYGFNKPTFGEGAEISFDVQWNGQYGNVNIATLQIINQGQPQQQGGYNGQGRSNGGGNNRGANTGGRAPAQASGGMSKDDYWKNREARDLVVQKQIQYQASRNAAIEVVKAGIDAGAVALPAAKAKAFDALLALVEEITDQFNDATTAVGNPKKPSPQRQVQQSAEPESGDENFDDADIPF